MLTLFFPIFPFDPSENSRKPKVFWCFQMNQKGTFGRKGSSLCLLVNYFNMGMTNISKIK